MRDFLIKLCFFTFCLAFIIPFTSCQQKTNYEYAEEQFQKGFERGREDMFLRIYNSIDMENEQILFYGDVWNTDLFALTIYDTINSNESYITYDLTIKSTTVGHCADYEDFFFNIYAISDSEGMILTSDDFIWNGALYYEGSTDDYLQGNNVKGKCKLLDNSEIQTLIIIIAANGHLYTATYNT